ncbi:hypothetical protein INO08_16080 [Staphylococcus aureus]|nr:hypothetical protein [Staphylococcus aureus]
MSKKETRGEKSMWQEKKNIDKKNGGERERRLTDREDMREREKTRGKDRRTCGDDYRGAQA